MFKIRNANQWKPLWLTRNIEMSTTPPTNTCVSVLNNDYTDIVCVVNDYTDTVRIVKDYTDTVRMVNGYADFVSV